MTNSQCRAFQVCPPGSQCCQCRSGTSWRPRRLAVPFTAWLQSVLRKAKSGGYVTVFSVIAYFFLAYAVTITLNVLICAALKGQKRARRTITACFLLLPLSPYAAVAVQTRLFRAAMRLPVRQAALDTGMLSGKARLTRILSITPWWCDVEVIEPCSEGACCGKATDTGQDANVLTLTRTGSGWKLQEWDTVWSDCGNADGNTFPPYDDGGL